MKQLIMIVAALLVSTYTFAELQSSNHNNTTQLKSLGSSFKSYSTVVPKIDPNDITMGYAGQDLSDNSTLA